MKLTDKQALQEYIMSLIPETIDTDVGTHVYLLYQERLKIAKAVTDGLIHKFEGQMMEKPKRYKNVGMSVEDRIYDMICDGCDQDPAMCHNQGYCEYDKKEIVEDDT